MQKKNDIIYNTIRTIILFLGHWLGGVNQTRGELPAAWVWLDLNKEILEYTLWEPTEPKGYISNCLFRTITRTWSAASCDKLGYCLCKYP